MEEFFEEAPLLPHPPTASAANRKLKLWKLGSLVWMIVLIAGGCVVTIIETLPFLSADKKAPLHNELNLSAKYWICWSLKFLYATTAIVAIFYLKKCAFVVGRHNPLDESEVGINNLERHARSYSLPDAPLRHPSTLFGTTFIIFAMIYCVSGGIEIICSLVEFISKNILREIFEAVGRILLMVFTILQTNFLHHYVRRPRQWNLSAIWFWGRHIMAVNIAAWLINVGYELREIREISTENHEADSKRDSQFINITVDNFCEFYSVDSASKLLYPFVVEYYVMSTLMAFTLVSNARHFGALLPSYTAQSHGIENPDTVGSQVRIQEDQRTALTFGLGFVVFSTIVSIFVIVLNKTITGQRKSMLILLAILYFGLIILHFCGIVCTALLLRSLPCCSYQEIWRWCCSPSSAHFTDRLLLWIGAVAIVINEFYTLCTTIANHGVNPSVERLNELFVSLGSALNIVQSIMQLIALETALVFGFPVAKLPNLLILLNLAEWIINSACFSFLFSEKTGVTLVMALLAMPLQVFYRFHSAACINEFRRHGVDHNRGHQNREDQNIGDQNREDPNRENHNT